MKILFVSMPSVHVIRWMENLNDTDFELYWFDVLDKGRLETLDSVVQFTGWKKRKLAYIKGEYFLSKKYSNLFKYFQPLLEITANEVLEKIILEIQPDIVHSFEMQSCSYPIFKTMLKYPKVKWLYSCWGNDLFYYKNFKEHRNTIKKVLKRVDFLHTDCQRDEILARDLGFTGIHLGVIPGGTGYNLQEFESYKLPTKERKIILVKGYEHRFGRALNVIKALALIQEEIQKYEIVVFGSHPVVINYISDNKLNFRTYSRHELSHQDVIKLMGKSLIYIGNSVSDGMANTLLEAIVMEAFPIQSNPGFVSEEIIEEGENGFLIHDPMSITEIKQIIQKALSNFAILEKAMIRNKEIAIKRLDYSYNKLRIINIYKDI